MRVTNVVSVGGAIIRLMRVSEGSRDNAKRAFEEIGNRNAIWRRADDQYIRLEPDDDPGVNRA